MKVAMALVSTCLAITSWWLACSVMDSIWILLGILNTAIAAFWWWRTWDSAGKGDR